jgi:hypothetical protein
MVSSAILAPSIAGIRLDIVDGITAIETDARAISEHGILDHLFKVGSIPSIPG